ncbi:GRAS family protein RAM1-like [Salvia divinorum]|uniref:GRAS family protein RAM1-like n=1 Tax=Salvia divinorum TaxID=28513 RepID=A0ABD1HYT2_SALDI
MLRMQEYEEEDFLCLRLSISADSDCERKRKRNETPTLSDSVSSDGSFEEDGKILSLFQTRDQMLNLRRGRGGGEDHPESDADGEGLRLVHLLLVAATSVDENSPGAALESLRGIYRGASLAGDSVQRVAAYFADGLVARLLARCSPFGDAVARDEAFLSYAELYKVSPLYQMAHFTANEAILEAFKKHDRGNPNPRVLHVIDFEVSYGFQWPSLMHSLSERATPARRILLKITGYGSCPGQLQETQARLTSFAQGFRNLVFEFTGIVRGSNLTKPKIKKGEILVANLSFHLSTLKNHSMISDTLSYLESVRPTIVVLVEQEGSRKTHNFLSRFTESLHYFAAIFDSLDDCLPLDSSERLRIEKNHLGTEIKHVMNYDTDGDDSLRFQSLETWKKRMESNGFRGVRHSPSAVMQAKLLLRMRSHCSGTRLDGGFRVFERDDGRALSLGWQEKLLITASSWCCV